MEAAEERVELELVCPACWSSLEATAGGGRRCASCGASYPRRAEVEVLLDDETWRATVAHAEHERETLRRYHVSRRESPLNILYYDGWVARMFRHVPEANRGPLVEIMCGEAEICRRLPQRFRSALALDLNPTMVEQAARDLEQAGETRVRLVCASATQIPLADQSAGVVMVQGGLHHVKPLLAQVVAEVGRILRPGGIFVASEPANDHWLTRRIRHWQYRRSRHQGTDPGEDGLTQHELDAALSAAGLRLDRYRRFGFIAFPFMGNTQLFPLLATCRWRALGRALIALDRVFEHIPLVRGMALTSLLTALKER